MKFRHTCDKNELNTVICFFQHTEKALKYIFRALLFRLVLYFIKQRFIILVDQNHAAPSGLQICRLQ